MPLVVITLAWVLVLFTERPAWAKDPLFRAMEVAHVGWETPAPEFSLATPEGKTTTLTQLQGRVVFLNFWATWCPPCRVEMPAMERLHKEFKDRGLAMVAVDIGESSKQVARFMKEFRLSFSALLDVDSAVSSRYRVQGIPTTFLIDRGGRVVGVARGARDWASLEGQALIRSLLDRKG
jgi:peroxiredoxin